MLAPDSRCSSASATRSSVVERRRRRPGALPEPAPQLGVGEREVDGEREPAQRTRRRGGAAGSWQARRRRRTSPSAAAGRRPRGWRSGRARPAPRCACRTARRPRRTAASRPTPRPPRTPRRGSSRSRRCTSTRPGPGRSATAAGRARRAITSAAIDLPVPLGPANSAETPSAPRRPPKPHSSRTRLRCATRSTSVLQLLDDAVREHQVGAKVARGSTAVARCASRWRASCRAAAAMSAIVTARPSPRAVFRAPLGRALDAGGVEQEPARRRMSATGPGPSTDSHSIRRPATVSRGTASSGRSPAPSPMAGPGSPRAPRVALDVEHRTAQQRLAAGVGAAGRGVGCGGIEPDGEQRRAQPRRQRPPPPAAAPRASRAARPSRGRPRLAAEAVPRGVRAGAS